MRGCVEGGGSRSRDGGREGGTGKMVGEATERAFREGVCF